MNGERAASPRPMGRSSTHRFSFLDLLGKPPPGPRSPGQMTAPSAALSRQDPVAGKDKASRWLYLPQHQAMGTIG